MARKFRVNEARAGWDIVSYFPFGPSKAVRNFPHKIENYFVGSATTMFLSTRRVTLLSTSIKRVVS